MKKLKLLFCLFSLILFLSCNKESSPTGPSSGPTVAMKATFEGGANGDFQGWRYLDTSGYHYVHFSHDVPSDGGSWSLQLQLDTMKQHHIYYKAIPPDNVLPKILSFSFDIKTVGSLALMMQGYVWSDSGVISFGGFYSEWTQWSRSTDLETLNGSRIDSITLDVSVGYGKAGDYALIDNVKIELYSQ